jgi:hypothetical protein
MVLTSPVVVRRGNQPNTPLGDTLAEIRRWLDSERIEPAMFKTVVHPRGLGFEMSFKSETEADRFRRQFPALVGITEQGTGQGPAAF